MSDAATVRFVVVEDEPPATPGTDELAATTPPWWSIMAWTVVGMLWPLGYALLDGSLPLVGSDGVPWTFWAVVYGYAVVIALLGGASIALIFSTLSKDNALVGRVFLTLVNTGPLVFGGLAGLVALIGVVANLIAIWLTWRDKVRRPTV